MLLWPKSHSLPFDDLDSIGGPNGPHAAFLKDFGKFILEKLKPKALLVFSAHWETRNQIEGNSKSKKFIFSILTHSLVMAYEKNHLLYDYGGFPDEMYRITWQSNGSPSLATRAAELLNKVPNKEKDRK